MQSGRENSMRPRRKCRPSKRLIEENYSFRKSSTNVNTKSNWRRLTRRQKPCSSNTTPASTSALAPSDCVDSSNKNLVSSPVFSFGEKIEGQKNPRGAQGKCFTLKPMSDENTSIFPSSINLTSQSNISESQLTRCQESWSSNTAPPSTSASAPSDSVDSSKKENKNPVAGEIYSFEVNVKGQETQTGTWRICSPQKQLTNKNTSFLQSSTNITAQSKGRLTRSKKPWLSNTTSASTSSNSTCLDSSKKENKNPMGSEVYSFEEDVKGKENSKGAQRKCFTQKQMIKENTSLQSSTNITSHSYRSGIQSRCKELNSSDNTTASASTYSTVSGSSNKTSKIPMGSQVSALGAIKRKENCSSNTTIASASEFSNKNKNPMGSDVPAIEVDRKYKPMEWTVEEVIAFISASDSGLACLADLFRKHEIDGWAFLLLTSDVMMKHMGINLGPAIKISCLIDGIKSGRQSSIDRKRKF